MPKSSLVTVLPYQKITCMLNADPSWHLGFTAPGMKCRNMDDPISCGFRHPWFQSTVHQFYLPSTWSRKYGPAHVQVIPNFTAATYSRRQNGISCNYLPQENVVFLGKKPWLMARVWGKLCGFIHYNVQYVVFIVAYVTLRQQFDIRWWQMF